jgi:hypothetical protein
MLSGPPASGKHKFVVITGTLENNASIVGFQNLQK